ncbi:hypothetical protein RFI_14220 [Reticulomyxa filosa]|uniref:Uncharacterized protein n=1 Tax=Reticulomyxa filosa TaxID=46433 RepID=X6NCC6_RETFI|nr:hypothetical protein RFI_14220 [Reticulomyxa filosa]|eukprot:ETO22967.1 hypothetical protein RFI_14220 [Reticulomyxa filosa]
MDWLHLIAGNRNFFKECLSTFPTDEKFEHHMQAFAENDQYLHSRASSLREVRTFLVDMLKRKFKTISEVQRYLEKFAADVHKETLESFSIVLQSHKSILSDVTDPQGWLFQQDKNLLYKIGHVKLSLSISEMKKSLERENYLTVGTIDSNKESKMMEQQFEVPTTLKQTEVEQLIDRLLMSLTGSEDGEELPLQQGISTMTSQDLEQLFQSHEKQFAKISLGALSKVLNVIKRNNYTGQTLLRSSSLSEESDQLVNKIIQFEVLKEKVKYDFVPKFEKCKSIAMKRLQYYDLGGKTHLESDKEISFDQSIRFFANIEQAWDDQLKKWKDTIKNDDVSTTITLALLLLSPPKFRLSIRTLQSKPQRTLYKRSDFNIYVYSYQKKNLLSSLWYIAWGQQKKKKKRAWKGDSEEGLLDRLGRFLQDSFASYLVKSLNLPYESPRSPLRKGKPYLHICQETQVLSHVLKLYLMEGQTPTACRVLFCDQSTTIEQLECFMLRCLADTGVDPCLHCLVLPELLSYSVQCEFVNMLRRQLKNKMDYLLRIICVESQSVIAQGFHVYRDNDPLALRQDESRQFYQKMLSSNWEAFQNQTNTTPFVQVFLSQNECVGKSYVINQMVHKLNLKKGHFVHVPINTCTVDINFLVDRFCNVPATDEPLVTPFFFFF